MEFWEIFLKINMIMLLNSKQLTIDKPLALSVFLKDKKRQVQYLFGALKTTFKYRIFYLEIYWLHFSYTLEHFLFWLNTAWVRWMLISVLKPMVTCVFTKGLGLNSTMQEMI
jgi:hypothetical protein